MATVNSIAKQVTELGGSIAEQDDESLLKVMNLVGEERTIKRSEVAWVTLKGGQQIAMHRSDYMTLISVARNKAYESALEQQKLGQRKLLGLPTRQAAQAYDYKSRMAGVDMDNVGPGKANLIVPYHADKKELPKPAVIPQDKYIRGEYGNILNIGRGWKFIVPDLRFFVTPGMPNLESGFANPPRKPKPVSERFTAEELTEIVGLIVDRKMHRENMDGQKMERENQLVYLKPNFSGTRLSETEKATYILVDSGMTKLPISCIIPCAEAMNSGLAFPEWCAERATIIHRKFFEKSLEYELDHQKEYREYEQAWKERELTLVKRALVINTNLKERGVPQSNRIQFPLGYSDFCKTITTPDGELDLRMDNPALWMPKEWHGEAYDNIVIQQNGDRLNYLVMGRGSKIELPGPEDERKSHRDTLDKVNETLHDELADIHYVIDKKTTQAEG